MNANPDFLPTLYNRRNEYEDEQLAYERNHASLLTNFVYDVMTGDPDRVYRHSWGNALKISEGLKDYADKRRFFALVVAASRGEDVQKLADELIHDAASTYADAVAE